MSRWLAAMLRVLGKSIYSGVNRAINTAVPGMQNINKTHYYVWIDLEMTGLCENKDKIVEVACILTNDQLNIIHEGINVIVHQQKEVWDKSNEWVQVQFEKNGLREKSLKSKISIEKGDDMISEYIKYHTNYKENNNIYYLAGNSVYMDKRFLEKYMIKVNELLHYRLIDVSTIKTLCFHWYPKEFITLPEKSHEHRALSDIMESINELKLYREKFFQKVEDYS